MKKILLILGILFILEKSYQIGFMAFGYFDPLGYGESSKRYAVETVENHFDDWNPNYLKSRYRKESISLGFAEKAADRIGQLEESYGKIKKITDVKQTAYSFQAMEILPPSDFAFYYTYQIYAEFEKAEVVIDIGLIKEGNSWGIRYFGIKTPLDSAVFVSKNANKSVDTTPASAPR